MSSAADGSDTASWFEAVKGEVPFALTGPSITLSPLPSPYPPTVFLYGGKVVQSRRMSDQMWAMDLNRREWSRVNAGTGPGVRYFHSMDVWEDKLVLFGGMSEQELNGSSFVHDDVWFFDCRTRRWLPQPSPTAGPSFEPIAQDPQLLPSARYAHLSAVSRDKLVVFGGQRHDNTWIYEISAYDLKRRLWVSKTPQPESHGLHSKGAYRSVALSTNQRVVFPHSDSHTFTGTQGLPFSEDEEGYGGSIYVYSNYDFAKVRREFEILHPLDDGEADPVASDKFASIPGYTVRDLSTKMSGVSQPPGLRFPSGGVVGHHFVLTGLYLASTSGAFSIWALDLTTMVWSHIEPTVLKTGSWNRPVLCPDSARLIVFGCADSDLTTDYGKRAVNLNHVAVIELEAYGIYRPPKQEITDKEQNMGLTLLDQRLLIDFEVVSLDNRRVKCSRRVLEKRWPWFAEQQASIVSRAGEIVHDVASLDIHDALVASLSPARMTPTRLYLPEEFAVCVAFVQYFYTLELSTPLQRRGPVLTSLLCLANQYKLERLRKLVVHTLHTRLEPDNALNLFQVASLTGEKPLASRCLSLLKHTRSNGKPLHSSHHRPSGTQSAHGGSSGSGTGSAPPHMGLPPDGTSSGTSTVNGNTTIQGAPEPHMFRRARADSLTCPEHLLSRFVDGEELLQEASANSSKSQEDSMVVSLFSALDLNSPPPSPVVMKRNNRPVSERSPSPSPSHASSTRKKRAPPMMPPPVRALPMVPHDALLTPPVTPHTPLADAALRASSPTNSESTSSYPRTPAESTRGSVYSTREDPMSPMAERRPSISDSSIRGKTAALPSLPEDDAPTFEISDDNTRVSTETSEGEHETLRTPCISIDPGSAPLNQSLNVQQEQAMRKLTANSGQSKQLTRATSLSSLGQRPHSAMATYTARDVREMGKAQAQMSVLAEDFGPVLSSTAERSKTWAKPAGESDMFSKRRSIAQPPAPVDSDYDRDREQLAKFHAFIAEQQRQAGSHEAEAIARKATGRAGRSRFGAWRSKVGNVLH
ncbi:galactose oxidase [Cutaneotrichosporon oleaginosum]|uniref:Galactose oxidase n=1 Tax=Cutaneotrichosporon oleaginosum TaxID=879819 RepID=A0A0J0XE20_9TREE|nr:galactose oxidase [Cutaneotrichosporon oleaginosum]KLT39350.1 galactose oxidase [Cutaneotrichosporon oleaginosum]TXT12103.1 hypothetical protein COLE_02513 [Cutaneotrichosporon oleaginosum]